MSVETPLSNDPICTCCGTAATGCRLLMAAPKDKAFICELCVAEAVTINIRHFRASTKIQEVPSHG